ncbi:MAG TPA: hypothetical protein VNC84_00545 [Gammaproteobacteria bacterium]|jgi:hypothetical protein|nr:hypothetical protein [Gammaproteobacteria bacterium]
MQNRFSEVYENLDQAIAVFVRKAVSAVMIMRGITVRRLEVAEELKKARAQVVKSEKVLEVVKSCAARIDTSSTEVQETQQLDADIALEEKAIAKAAAEEAMLCSTLEEMMKEIRGASDPTVDQVQALEAYFDPDESNMLASPELWQETLMSGALLDVVNTEILRKGVLNMLKVREGYRLKDSTHDLVPLSTKIGKQAGTLYNVADRMKAAERVTPGCIGAQHR